MILLMGGVAFLSLKYNQLKLETAKLEESLNDSEKKANALKQKYSEEKARGATLLREKLSAASKMREFESLVDTLKREVETAKGSEIEKAQELNRKLEVCGKDLAAISENLQKVKSEHMDTQGKFKQTTAALREKEGDLAKKQDHINNLESQLKTAGRKIERVVSHNSKLAELSQELLVQFDNKGVFSSMLQKEPFTQAKRVSLEKMIQDYLDRIDKETVLSSDG